MKEVDPKDTSRAYAFEMDECANADGYLFQDIECNPACEVEPTKRIEV